MKVAMRKRTILYCSYYIAFRIYRQLVRMATEHNCQLIALSWDESKNGCYTGQFPIDGVISLLTCDHTMKLITSTGNAPHVTLHVNTASELPIPSVVGDHISAGRMVAEHFLKRGFKHFAAFVNLTPYQTFNERLQGYSEAIVQAGFSPPEVIAMRRDEHDVLQHFRDALKKLPIPLAIMSSNDRAAVRVMDACRLCDLAIPLQVAVCGFDNDPIVCEVTPIPLSSLDTNPERQAQEAFHILLDRLHGQTPALLPHVMIEPKELVVRRSSGLQAHGEEPVTKALAYIHEHACNHTLDIAAVVDSSGVSKPTLFRLFRKFLAITPLQYITQLRVDRARYLLKETGQNINEVRPRCGFATDYQMYRAFKRTTGLSPRNFKSVEGQDIDTTK